MKNQKPDETQNEFQLAIDNVGRVDVNDFNSFALEEFHGDGNVLQLLRTKDRADVVLIHFLLGEHFDESDERQSV